MNFDLQLAIENSVNGSAYCAHCTSFDLKIIFTVKYEVI